MIPRRRIAFEIADFVDAARVLWVNSSQVLAQVAAFERAFGTAVGVRHAVAVASGRDALSLILDGLGVAAGDELIIPAYTLGELLPLMQARGIIPVPADIDPETFNVTAASVDIRIGPRTRAILVVHLLGAPCDVRAICGLGVPVIEDCAHAIGARIDGHAVGSFGHAALFSLEATKAVSAFGGGVLATDDDMLAANIRTRISGRARREWPVVRKFLFKLVEELVVRSPAYELLARMLFSTRSAGGFDRFYRRAHDRVRGTPGAFSGVQARLGLRRLGRVELRNLHLNALWDDLARQLPDRFTAQQRSREGEPAFYNFVARFDGDITALRAAAQRRGLDLGIGGEAMDDTAAMLGFTDCPGAAQVRADAVLIPLYDGMSQRRQQRMIAILHGLARELP